MDEQAETTQATSRARRVVDFTARKAGGFADRVERPFLETLRFVGLALAALILLGALGLMLYGMALQVGRSNFEPKAVDVATEDLAPPPRVAMPRRTDAPKEGAARWLAEIPEGFRKAYYATYARNFAAYRRPGDEPVTTEQFMDAMFDPDTLDQIILLSNVELTNQGEGNRLGTGEVLERMHATVRAASKQNFTKNDLADYRAAKKKEVCRDVTKMVSRQVAGWNDSSMSCPGWYQYPYGCPETRTVSEPEASRQCSMEFPTEISGPLSTMETLQTRYLNKLAEKWSASQENAALRSDQAIQRKTRGLDAIANAGTAFVAFLGLMFLFLLVALERHHRRMADGPRIMDKD